MNEKNTWQRQKCALFLFFLGARQLRRIFVIRLEKLLTFGKRHSFQSQQKTTRNVDIQ